MILLCFCFILSLSLFSCLLPTRHQQHSLFFWCRLLSIHSFTYPHTPFTFVFYINMPPPLVSPSSRVPPESFQAASNRRASETLPHPPWAPGKSPASLSDAWWGVPTPHGRILPLGPKWRVSPGPERAASRWGGESDRDSEEAASRPTRREGETCPLGACGIRKL